MSSSKQWIPNKIFSAKRSEPKPFDGAIINDQNTYYFQFSCPGLVGGKFPNNMWANAYTLFKGKIEKNKKWFLIARCLLQNGIVTSCNLEVTSNEPELPKVTKNSPPTTISVIIWVGYGTSKAYKMFSSAIVIKPVLVQRAYKTNVECGLSNYEDYYSLVAIQ